MKIEGMLVVLDAADLEAVSSFWAGLLGGTVSKDEDWYELYVDGEHRMDFQHAPDHVQPDWPDGEPQQIHLDLYVGGVENIAAAHEEAVRLGARVLQEAEDLTKPSGFQVYADPAGHPFCLCWGQ